MARTRPARRILLATAALLASALSGPPLLAAPADSEPDLDLFSLSVPSDLEPGSTYELTAVVIYDGEAPTGAFHVRFLLDGSLNLGDEAVGALEPGETFQLNSDTWIVTVGLHDILVIADVFDEVAEEDETNNEASSEFLVVQRVDLVALALRWTPDPVVRGDIVQATGTFANLGPVAAGAWVVLGPRHE